MINSHDKIIVENLSYWKDYVYGSPSTDNVPLDEYEGGVGFVRRMLYPREEDYACLVFDPDNNKIPYLEYHHSNGEISEMFLQSNVVYYVFCNFPLLGKEEWFRDYVNIDIGCGLSSFFPKMTRHRWIWQLDFFRLHEILGD